MKEFLKIHKILFIYSLIYFSGTVFCMLLYWLFSGEFHPNFIVLTCILIPIIFSLIFLVKKEYEIFKIVAEKKNENLRLNKKDTERKNLIVKQRDIIFALKDEEFDYKNKIKEINKFEIAKIKDNHIINNPEKIHKHCFNVIKRRVTEQLIYEGDNYHFEIFTPENTDNSQHNYKLLDTDEQVIIKSSTTNNNWFIITTKRLISNYENKVIENLYTNFDDIDDDLLLDGDIYGEKNFFEIYGIRTKNNELVKIELKTGIPYLAVLNCIQRLLRLYFRYEKEFKKFKNI